MKKKEIIFQHQKGVFKNIFVENFDENVYFHSPRFDDKEVIYCLIDKKTEIAVVFAKNKKELLKKYFDEKIQKKYEEIRKTKYYKDLIKEKEQKYKNKGE